MLFPERDKEGKPTVLSNFFFNFRKFSFLKMQAAGGIMNALGKKKKMGQIKLVCCERSAAVTFYDSMQKICSIPQLNK